MSTPSEIWNDILKNNVEKDDPLWNENLDKVAAFEARMVNGIRLSMFSSYMLAISCYLHDKLAAYHRVEHRLHFHLHLNLF